MISWLSRWLSFFVAKISRPFLYLLYHAPRSVRWALGDLLGCLWFDVFRIRRKLALDNLTLAFPEWSQAQRVKVARQSLRNMGRNLIEYASLPFLSEKDKSQFQLIGEENLVNALAEKKGICLLTLHLGNGDMGTAALALHGYPIHLISKEFKWKWLNEAWFKVRARLGTRFIAPRNSSIAILRALKKNGIVAFVLDQFMGPPLGVKTTFFGRETGTAVGLAVIASRSKVPVVPVYTHRDKQGQTHVFIEPPIAFEEKEDPDESLAYMTQVYNDHLEKFVRRHPEQWMWIHRRWKPFRINPQGDWYLKTQKLSKKVDSAPI